MEDRIDGWKKGGEGSRQADLLLNIHTGIYTELSTLKRLKGGARTEVSKLFLLRSREEIFFMGQAVSATTTQL